MRNTRFNESSAWLFYRYSGLGLPLLDFSASQDYSNATIFADAGGVTVDVGDLKERDRTVSLLATLVRPRFRTYSVLSFGGEIESIDFSTTPDTLLPLLSPFFADRR